MKKKNQRKIILIILSIINIFLVIAACITPSIINVVTKNNVQKIQIANAEVDFEKKDITKGNIYLDGDWKYYPNKWIITDKESELDDFTYVNPSKSTEQNVHYASYQITLKNFETSSLTTLYLNNSRCSYRIFVNGIKCIESGILSKNDSISKNSICNKIGILTNLDTEKTVLVIEISCKYTRGLQVIPVLSNYSDINHQISIYVIAVSIIFGLFIATSLGVLINYIIDKNSSPKPHIIALFFNVFAIFLFHQPGVELLNHIKGFNYEFSYFILYVLFQILFLILSFIVFDELHKSKFLKKKYLIFPPIITLLAIISSIHLMFTNYFDVSAKLLMILSLISPVYIIILSFIYCKKNGKYSSYLSFSLNALWISTWVLPIIFFNLTNRYEINYFFFSVIILSLLFISSYIIYYDYRKQKLYEYQKEINDLKDQINQSNASILLSQIRPHFLYNTLNTIVYLCRSDPKRAEDAIIAFSKYLRANMNSLEKKEVIPFEEELNHIKNYVKIEQLRFGKKLMVIYNIKVIDFMVPPLSVQPLVENAIKHGITKKADGGKLFLSTNDDDNYVYITIEDTGVGFDVKGILNHYKSNSIGLHNITQRLKILSNGEIIFESKIGKGTKVKIKIPRIQEKK